jgi:hypothetical protein
VDADHRVLEVTEEGFERRGRDRRRHHARPAHAGQDRAHPQQRPRRRLHGQPGRQRQLAAPWWWPTSSSTTRKSGEPLDYLAFAKRLEQEVRAKFEDAGFEIQIIGFAKQIGDIAEGAKSVVQFFALAFVLTALAVWWYSPLVALTVLPMACSLVSLVWQFGTLQLLGYGLDPLAVLVPFLVFAIGVSHGVQQINYIVQGGLRRQRRRHAGAAQLHRPADPRHAGAGDGLRRLRHADLIPIPMIRELAITASLGVAYKIVTNLIMLPVAASYFSFDQAYVDRALPTARARAMASWRASAASPSRATRPSARCASVALFAPAPGTKARAAMSAPAARRARAARRLALQPRRGGDRQASSTSASTC